LRIDIIGLGASEVKERRGARRGEEQEDDAREKREEQKVRASRADNGSLKLTHDPFDPLDY
jgi:hypothetical protein